MACTIRFVALMVWIGSFAAPLLAELTPPPPDWQDGASVYLTARRNAPEKIADERPATAEVVRREIAANEVAPSAAVGPQAVPEVKIDTAIEPAMFQVEEPPASAAPAADDKRRLAPPSDSSAFGIHSADSNYSNNGSTRKPRRLGDFGLPVDSLYTIGSALAIVIGLFLLFAWVLRRGGRRMSRGNYLPADVVSVVGRVPLPGRQFAELLRVGNKLVLVSFTPTGIETLTEVTDPAEVDRLLGLCQQSNPYSTTTAFEQVFQQMSNEAAPSGFLGAEALPSSFSSPAAAYRAHQGNYARA